MKPVVIFVDDEANVLRGLRRFTRIRRDSWDMHFVESGREAVEIIADNDVDVVVSDMRMPEMTGADLLEHISQNVPNIIRIILSGEAERAQTYRTVGKSHRFLAKPCDPDALIGAIDALLALRAQLSLEYVLEDISIFDELRTPTASFYDLENILSEDDPCVQRVVASIESDPSLSIRVLQLANSAYFGRPSTTCSVKQAVNAIGVGALRDLLEQKRLGNAGAEIVFTQQEQENRQRASALAKHAALKARNMGADQNIEDAVFAAGLFSTLCPKRKDGSKGKNGASFNLPVGAGYIASLFGLPPLLTNTLFAMSAFDANASVEENAGCICDALMTDMGHAA